MGDRKAAGGGNCPIRLFGASNGVNGDGRPMPPAVTEWEGIEKLRNESVRLGFFITGHPLDKYAARLFGVVSLTTESLKNRQHQERVKLAGVIHSLKLKNNKKGDRYATFNFEDKDGVVEVIVWPESYRKHEAAIHADQPVLFERRP